LNNSSSSSTGAQKPSGESTGPAPQAPAWRVWQEESGPEPVKALTREQVQQLGLQRPSVSVWQVLLWQALVGVGMALALGVWSGRWSLAWSLLYGAAAVVVPGLVFARGLTGRLSSISPGTAVMGFFVWEFVKIGLTIAILVAAPRLVEGLSWPALLVGLVVTMKVVWPVVWFKTRQRRAT
jgi:ATP synthase protein I